MYQVQDAEQVLGPLLNELLFDEKMPFWLFWQCGYYSQLVVVNF